jgi:hypothetical protein
MDSAGRPIARRSGALIIPAANDGDYSKGRRPTTPRGSRFARARSQIETVRVNRCHQMSSQNVWR